MIIHFCVLALFLLALSRAIILLAVFNRTRGSSAYGPPVRIKSSLVYLQYPCKLRGWTEKKNDSLSRMSSQ